jgi:hypothetical protein
MHITITLISFSVFFVESLCHYNIGRNGQEKNNKFLIHLPNATDFVKLVIVLLFFSIINSILIKYFVCD